MAVSFQYLMGMGMGMGVIFENGFGCGYSSTLPEPIPTRNTAPARIYRRCFLTERPRANYRDFGLSYDQQDSLPRSGP